MGEKFHYDYLAEDRRLVDWMGWSLQHSAAQTFSRFLQIMGAKVAWRIDLFCLEPAVFHAA